VILVDGFYKWEWLADAAYTKLLEKVMKPDVQLNTEKTRIVDLTQGESFSSLTLPEETWGWQQPPAIRYSSGLQEFCKKYS
jgi:hypothetical protein